MSSFDQSLLKDRPLGESGLCCWTLKQKQMNTSAPSVQSQSPTARGGRRRAHQNNKRKIMRYLDDKYSDPVKDELLDMSSLVDPRFRTTYIDPDKVEPVQRRAVAEMMSLPAPAQQPGTAVQVRQEDAQPPPKKKMTLATI
ncbi:hypothetical protein F7725_010685 [Dissostichus mawsoni]|uniref:Uncharacterized protein n=1 Tax=Dissostichus mawsoni TaxID=36200 RepID=A0A7J5XQR8_DISMA|nr:hypothetical protein F7725_010685 [Dissostichus mawsoni]